MTEREIPCPGYSPDYILENANCQICGEPPETHPKRDIQADTKPINRLENHGVQADILEDIRLVQRKKDNQAAEIRRLLAEVERLKAACDGYLAHAAGLRAEVERLRLENGLVMAEVATERAENERLKRQNYECYDNLYAENERLTLHVASCEDSCSNLCHRLKERGAENEKLRGALERIAACKHVGTKAMQMVQTIARAALQSKGEKW